MVSPIVIFYDWSQRRLPVWLQMPVEDKSLRDYLEEKLEIELSDSFPFSPAPEESETKAIVADEEP